jgi:hypothetical protein
LLSLLRAVLVPEIVAKVRNLLNSAVETEPVEELRQVLGERLELHERRQ